MSYKWKRYHLQNEGVGVLNFCAVVCMVCIGNTPVSSLKFRG
jgi:hypothetical protein